MSSVAKRLIIIFSIIFGIAAVVGGSVALMMNRPSTVIARSERLDAPVVRGVEKEDNKYMLTFSYVSDAEGYMVNEYDTTTDERHTKTYKGEDIVTAGEYVKVDITSFLFNTHTEEDFREYVFTVTARYADQVFNSKESLPFIYKNTIQLDAPVISTINPKLTSVNWNSVDYATSYRVYLYQEEQQNNNIYISTTEPYVTFDDVKRTFGNLESYNLYVVAKNLSLTKQDYILDSEKSENALYIPTGQLKDIVLTLNEETKVLTWPRVVGANNYYLYISTNGTSPYASTSQNPGLFVATQNTISCDLNNIEIASYLGTIEYYVKAVSSNPNIEESVSNKVVGINKRELLAPSNIKIVGDDTQNLKVLWDASLDEMYTAGYVLRVYRYTQEQTQDLSIISAPQDYAVTSNDYTNINACEYSFSLKINPEGFYGVAVKAIAPQNSAYKDSEFTYYKNEENKNYYNANKKLPAPNGIVAIENADGTISVSWNRVQNALRYVLKIESADGTGSPTQEYVFTDKKEDINRVYSKIPPQTVTDLIPGKYIISVRSQSYAFMQSSEQDYNYSVSYPNDQNYAVYRIAFDLGDLNLQFNETEQTLSWASVAGAASYDVHAGRTEDDATLVANTTSLNYNLTTFFNDYRNETGNYKIFIVVKPEQNLYKVATKSPVIEYAFKQKYQAPTGLNVADTSTNGRSLEWQPSINANANTKYSVIVNFNVVIEETQETSVDITDYLVVGGNIITVSALGDDVNLESEQAAKYYIYKYTLSAISGEIGFLAIPEQYESPAVYLVFTEVKNALGYNVSINSSANTLYYNLTPVANGKSALMLNAADVQKLNPFVVNTVSITPSNSGASANSNIIVPNNITRTENFNNIFALPALNQVTLLTTSVPTSIISKITDKTINISFMPINIEASSYDVVKPVNNYIVNIFEIVGTQAQYLNDYILDISGIALQPDGSVVANIFDAFKKDEISLFGGDIYVAVSAAVASPAEVVAPMTFAGNSVQIALGLTDVQNVTYNETADGMMLSWDAVLNATSYEVEVDGVTLPQTTNTYIDLQSVLYNKQIGNYSVKVTAFLGDKQVSATQTIEVKKPLVLGEFVLTENNTKINFAQNDMPHTLYDGGDDYIYATHIVMVFDNIDAASTYATTESALNNYMHKIVPIASLTLENGIYTIDISEFDFVKTCYIYAFNNDNLAGVSLYATLDVGGAVRYADPNMRVVPTGNDFEVDQIDIEYLPFENDVLTPAQYVLDVLNNGVSILSQSFVENNFVAYTLDLYNAVIWDFPNVEYTDGKIVITIVSSESKVLNFNISDINAGNYLFKLQAVSTNRAYANSSNVVEKSLSLLKTIEKPTTRFVPYNLTTSAYYPEDSTNQTQIGDEITGINIDDYAGHPFKVYFSNNTIDGITLNNVIIKVVTSNSTVVVDGVSYLLKQDTYGYYIELDKHALGITKPECYTVMAAYKSPNSAYYHDSDYTVVTKLYVENCTSDFGVSNLLITKVQNGASNGYTISWELFTGYVGNNIDFKLYELLSNGTYDTTSPVYTFSHLDSLPYLTEFTLYDIHINDYSSSKTYIGELIIDYNASTIEGEGYVTGTYNIIPFAQKVLLFNESKSVVYDDVNDKLIFTLDNTLAFESGIVDTIILNGNIYMISACTYNTITLNNGQTIINALQNSLGNNLGSVPPQDRLVDVVVYAADKVLYNDSVMQFPVFVPQYASGITLLNDDTLCWDSIQYVSSYKVYVNDILKATCNTSSIALSKLGIFGGEYSFYVESDITGLTNVYILANTKDQKTITYLQAYETVSSINYSQTIPGSYNLESTADYQFVKTLTFKTSATEHAAPANLDNAKFVISIISGGVTKTINAVSSGVYSGLADKSNYVVFTRNANNFSVDLTEILNEEMLVGEYSISIILSHIDTVATDIAYKYYIQSKPSSLSIINKKIISIPAANIWDYIGVNPDELVTIGSNGIAQPVAGYEDYLELVKDNFNEKIFVVKAPFKYATSIEISIKPEYRGDTIDVSLNNVLGHTSSGARLADTKCRVAITLILDQNTVNLGNFVYYYVPTLAELGLSEDGVISVNSGAYAISRFYSKNFYNTLPTPQYNVQTTDPDYVNGVSGLDIITLNATLQSVISYTEVTNNEVPPYASTPKSSTQQQFIINIYENEVEAGVNKPKGYTPFVNTCTYQKIVSGAETISINDIMQEFNLPLGKYWVSLALYNGCYENASPYLISSFNGTPVMFDYYFVLGNIVNATYSNAAHQISFNMVDTYVYNDNPTKLYYFITLKDAEGNEKTFNCLVNPSVQGSEATIESTDYEQCFNIDQNKLVFDVDAFVKDLTRTNYYFVGDYTYYIVVATPNWVADPQNSEKPLPATFDINNIKSSQMLEEVFTYKAVYPIQYVNAELQQNTISWEVTDNSGLDLTQIPHVWQYKIGVASWESMVNVNEQVTASGYICDTKIMLSYISRLQHATDLKLRLYILNNSNYLSDENGRLITVDPQPKLPDITNFVVNTAEANGNISFRFDNTVINNSVSGVAYYLTDLQQQKFIPAIDVIIEYEGQTYTITYNSEDLITYYTNLNGSFNIITLMSMTQKQHLTQTTKGVTELKSGSYKVKLKLYDVSENQYYLESVTEEQNVNIVPRWDIKVTNVNVSVQPSGDGKAPLNTGLSADNIRYYYDLLDADGNFKNKGLTNNNAQGWANGLRSTTLQFDIVNATEEVSNLSVVVWLIEYNVYKQNNNTLVARSTDKKLTFNILSNYTVSQEGVCHITLDITSIWQTVTLPKEYYVAFYLQESKDNLGENIRRKSLTSSHSEALNEVLGQNVAEKQDRIYAVINYKNLPTVELFDYFENEEDGLTFVLWEETKTANDVFGYDVTITKQEYNAGGYISTTTFGSVKNVIAENKIKDGKKYKAYNTSLILDLENEECYMVVVAVSNLTDDAYYIGNAGDANNAKAESKKMYKYLNIYEAPKDSKIESYTTEDKTYKAELSNAEADKDGINMNNVVNPDKNVNVVIVNEETINIDDDKASSKLIDITFKQPNANVKAYSLQVIDNNGAVTQYFIGRINQNTSQKLFIYYSDSGFTIPYSLQDSQNARAIYINTNEEVGEILGENVKISELSLQQLFGDKYNNGGNYTLTISAYIPVYFQKYNAKKWLDENGELQEVGVNPNINNYNGVNERLFRYYIKFATPQITKIEVSGDVAGVVVAENGSVSYSYIQNNGGNYSYTITFTVSNIGKSTDEKILGIYKVGNTKLSDMLLVDCVSNNGIATASIVINENSQNSFAKLVNTSLPGSLSFNAVILPKGLSSTFTLNPKSGSDSYSIYKESNELAKNADINSMVSESPKEITIGIQLPNVPLAVYLNQITDKQQIDDNVYNIKKAAINNDKTANNIYKFKNINIAVDPYLGIDFNANKTREYLYNQYFNNADFAFKVAVEVNGVTTELGVDKDLKINEVLNCNGRDSSAVQNTNLYNTLINIADLNQGGKAKLKFKLYKKTASNLFIDGEDVILSLDFYVRDENVYNISELNYNFNNPRVVTYNIVNNNASVSKADYYAPEVTADVKTGDASVNDSKLLVKLNYKYDNYTSDDCYMVVDNKTNVMSWILDNYANTTKVVNGNAYTLLNKSNPAADNFIMYALAGGASTEATWDISFTVEKAEGYVLSNYVSNTKTFSPKLKLMQTNTTVTYYNGRDTTLVPTQRVSIATDKEQGTYSYFSGFTMFTNPVFNNINRSARYIEITSVIDPDNVEIKGSVTDSVGDKLKPIPTNNGYNNVASVMSLENREEFINKLKEYFAGLTKVGQYKIYYRYVNYPSANNETKSVLPCDDGLMYTYDNYNIQEQNYYAIVVHDGVSSVEDIPAHVQEMVNNIKNNKDGVIIIPHTPQVDYQVYIKQKDAETNKIVYTKFNVYNEEKIGSDRYGYYYIPFKADKADCLDMYNNNDDAISFIEGQKTRYLGNLQAGTNQFLIIGQNPDALEGFDVEGSSRYKLISIGKTEATVNHLATININAVFKLPAEKYLKFAEDYEGQLNPGRIATENSPEGRKAAWENSAITELKETGVNIVKFNSSNGLETACPKCHGSGKAVTSHKHEGISLEYARNAMNIDYLTSSWGYNRFTCIHCGAETNEWAWTHETVRWGSGCYRLDICDECNGTGKNPRDNTKLAGYTYEALSCGLTDSGQLSNRDNPLGELNGAMIRTWIFDKKQTGIYVGDKEAKTVFSDDKNVTDDGYVVIVDEEGQQYIIGRNIRMYVQNGTSAEFWIAKLMLGTSLTQITLHSNYNFRLKYGENKYVSTQKGEYNYTIGLGQNNLQEGIYTLSLVPKAGFENCFEGTTSTENAYNISDNIDIRSSETALKAKLSEKCYAAIVNLSTKTKIYVDGKGNANDVHDGTVNINSKTLKKINVAATNDDGFVYIGAKDSDVEYFSNDTSAGVKINLTRKLNNLFKDMHISMEWDIDVEFKDQKFFVMFDGTKNFELKGIETGYKNPNPSINDTYGDGYNDARFGSVNNPYQMKVGNIYNKNDLLRNLLGWNKYQGMTGNIYIRVTELPYATGGFVWSGANSEQGTVNIFSKPIED